MKIPRSHLFLNSPRARRWLDEIIEYISASYTNPELWKVIQEIGDKRDARRVEYVTGKALKEGKTISEITGIELAPENSQPSMFFSIDFYLSLSMERERNTGGDHAGHSLHSVGEAFQLLIEANILLIPYAIYHRDSSFKRPTLNGQSYRVDNELLKYLLFNDLLYNHLFGFNYIIDKYSESVVKIESKHGEDVFLGTGWIYDARTLDSDNGIIRLIVTNAHVVNGSSGIRVLSKGDKVINHYEVIELFKEGKGIDVALLRIDYDKAMPAFFMHPEVPLLEEVITIGYPSVPLSREAYQLVHRGEVNAQVTDYFEQDLLVISSRTAPGNSGSPVVDDTGRVVGMVTQQLFEKTAFEQKGVTPYTACIPAKSLIKAIEEIVISQAGHTS